MNKISLSHGGGGRLMHELITEIFLKRFNNPTLAELTDAALINSNTKRLAFSTDSYVVKPLFFPGGDIGKLAIFGTVNDLVVMGAKPLFVSLSLIIEEGFSLYSLKRVTSSIAEAAKETAVEVVTGDTKVVERGSADGVFLNTSGIGEILGEVDLSIKRINVGDKIILSGTIADHGIAVLSSRRQLGFKPEVRSDCAPLNELILTLLKEFSEKIKFMRDPTRGGLGTTLNEMVREKRFGIQIEEEKIPIKESVSAACELLGFDPLYLANEGKVVMVVDNEAAGAVWKRMGEHPLGKRSRVIGKIVDGPRGRVVLKTKVGGRRIVDMLVGEQLPRIC